MCAICGIIKSDGKVDEKLLYEMTRVMKYRGPDEEGYFLEKNVGLGHRRLSIIDLKTGKQPLFSEDKKIVLICNGEIYNFKELRKNLEKKGHQFKTNSDNEVIIHLYEEKKEKCVNDLRGMFGFAIWDEKEKMLFMARDRLGQKPLVYSLIGKDIIFSSEIKSLLLYPEIKKETDFEAMSDYLTYQAIPSPKTIFKNIKKLPPAHYLIWKNGNLKIERYWNVDFSKKIKLKDEIEYQELLWEKLKEATKLRLISDVPLGAFLSGGIDSSTIVGLMSELSPSPVKTFSIGFDVENYSELKYAKLVAERFRTEHYEFTVKPDVVELLPKLIWHYNEPFADTSLIPTYYVARETSKYVKVALNGDGGDENLAGYDRYYQTILGMKIINFLKKLPLKNNLHLLIKKFYILFPSNFLFRAGNWLLETSKKEPYFLYAHRMWIFSDELKDKLLKESLKKDLPVSSLFLLKNYWNELNISLLEKMLYTDLHLYLPEVLMVKIDIATMANSLEGRSPFLDHKFIETVASFPPELKLKGKTSKYILKKKLKGFLPDKILKRKKMGFSPPIKEWFKKELKDMLKEYLSDKKFTQRGYFNQKFVEKMLKEFLEEKRDWSHGLWLLLVFELWCRIFLDGERI